MNIFNKLFPDNLYHSYVIEGDPETTAFELLKFLKENSYIEAENPDIFFQIYDSLTIDDSRNIKEWHSEKKITEKKKVCIIGVKFINHEAQRSLLKILEEPAVNTHFFIIMPNSSLILDTILSRVHIIKTLAEDDSFKKKAQDIYSSKPKYRIEIIGEIIKEYKDEENSGKLRYGAIKIINEIELLVYNKWKDDKKNKKTQFILNELQKCRDYSNISGASIKMILEHIALVL
jgi:DNA polymerase III delta prime subunit